MGHLKTILGLQLALRAVSIVAIGSLLAWGLLPMPSHRSLSVDLEDAPIAEDEEALEPILDFAVFDVSLWYVPQEPPKPKAERRPARIQPPTFELLGIVTETDGTRSAALFDPAANEIRQVSPGDAIGVYQVTQVHAGVVTLAHGETQHDIALVTGREGGK